MIASPVQSEPTLQLTAQELAQVQGILREQLAGASPGGVVQAWAFGSRATGHARPYSDLDILLTQPSALSWRHRADLVDALEQSRLPFHVDVVDAQSLHASMRERVWAERKLLFQLP